MSSNPRSPVSVTWKQVHAFRLARHHLTERAPQTDLLSVLGDMGCAQAQLLPAAQVSLWARVQGLQAGDIENALDQKKIVKAACMRRTLFLVPSRDLAVYVRGTARRAEKEIRWARGRGVPDRTIESAIQAALGVLDEPLTRPEIAGRVSKALGVQKQAVHGGGWGRRSKLAAVPVGHLIYPVVDLLHLAAARGVVCYGPPRRHEPTFVRADAWIPRWRDVPAQQAEDLLLRLYLRAFGPATPVDFSLWTGIGLTEARLIWSRSQARMAAVLVEGSQASILREDLDELAEAGFRRPLLRLLPYFDSYLLGHKDRGHLAPRQHLPKVYRPQGWISPVVLVDGRATATWAYSRQGDRLRLQISGFEPLAPRLTARLHTEAQDLGRFLAASRVDIQLDPLSGEYPNSK